jgi:hypothetical protein
LFIYIYHTRQIDNLNDILYLPGWRVCETGANKHKLLGKVKQTPKKTLTGHFGKPGINSMKEVVHHALEHGIIQVN